MLTGILWPHSEIERGLRGESLSCSPGAFGLRRSSLRYGDEPLSVLPEDEILFAAEKPQQIGAVSYTHLASAVRGCTPESGARANPTPATPAKTAPTMATAISRLRRVFLRFKLFTWLEFAFTAHPFQGEKSRKRGPAALGREIYTHADWPLGGLLLKVQGEVLKTQ